MANEPFEWHPAKFLRTQDPSPDFALLILNQPLRNGHNLRRLWRNGMLPAARRTDGLLLCSFHAGLGIMTDVPPASLRVAADGGANRLHELSSFQAKFVSLLTRLALTP